MRPTNVSILLSILLACTTGAAAQIQDSGQLNDWTTRPVSRSNASTGDVYLRAVRASKDSGYERIVFEFTGGAPAFSIKSERGPRFDTDGERSVQVHGTYFLHLTFTGLPYPDSQKDAAANVKMPQPGAGMTLLREVKEIEWFEGYRDIVLGLNAKPRYRVTRLSSPDRLVVDLAR